MACAWDNPGTAPLRTATAANVAAAVAHYTDIPSPVRAALIDKVRRTDPDARVDIQRDGVGGAFGTAGRLRDMHFAGGRMCVGPVSRAGWAENHVEPALVYCASGHCIAIPRVCGNVSRIDYTPGGGTAERQAPIMPMRTVPEPATWWLALAGLASVWWRKR